VLDLRHVLVLTGKSQNIWEFLMIIAVDI